MTRFLAVGAISLGLLGCARSGDSEKPASVKNVYVTHPEGGGASAARTFTASVEEGKSVNVSFKTGGEIKRLPLKEGDHVAKGQTIGTLDDADYRLSLQQVQAQYDQMASELKRLDEMYRRSNIAPNDYEKAKAGFEQLKVQLDLVKNKLAYTRLTSPVSGHVVEKYMEEGEMTGAGTPVYRILDTSSLETTVALPADIYTHKSEITSCTGLSAATGEKPIPLTILGFVPDADNNSLFKLRLLIPAGYRDRLMPGMNMSVTLHFAEATEGGRSSVASRALFERDGKEYVWVVDPKDSTVRAKEVHVIGVPNGANSVVEGLTGSEAVVAAGVNHLTAGEKVRVVGDIRKLKHGDLSHE